MSGTTARVIEAPEAVYAEAKVARLAAARAADALVRSRKRATKAEKAAAWALAVQANALTRRSRASAAARDRKRATKAEKTAAWEQRERTYVAAEKDGVWVEAVEAAKASFAAWKEAAKETRAVDKKAAKKKAESES